MSNAALSRTLMLVVCLTDGSVRLFGQREGQIPSECERALLERIARLEERLTAFESKFHGPGPAAVAEPAAPSGGANPTASEPSDSASPWWKSTTVNPYFDGYYLWNGVRPADRVNLLRAYDVSANSFSINQAGVVLETPVDPAAGRRWGYRLDLQYGQATETLQGSTVNELRPHVYRPVFQAFGTYVAPVGKGLSIDYGKWASALGYEGNYTKDQINYSRSYLFNYLPFYHMGFRLSYPVTDRLSLGYWLVNGANQTEDFNGFKSQLAQAVIKPTSRSTWTVNYYVGQEQRDPAPSSATPADGRFHVFDTYAQLGISDRVTLVGEFDWVINRAAKNSPPQRLVAGAAYLKVQITPRVFVGQRYVRLSDSGAMFSGAAQTLNDLTSTLAYRVVDGFEARLEYRRDLSNTPYFPSPTADVLAKSQDTFTLGLLWWFGGKQGVW
jgi:hypothetical protein